MTLELGFVNFIRVFFDHCHVTFPYKEIVSYYAHCHVTCPYMEPLSFFGRFVPVLVVSCFLDSFDQKTTEQSDGSSHA